MLTDVVGADKNGEIIRGEDEDRQVSPQKTLCAGMKPRIPFSLISYLQTGAWQDRSCTWEVEEAGRGRVGMRKTFRGDQRRSRYSSPATPTPTLSLLHWSGNDRFHSCLRSWRGEVVSDYQGGARGCDVELRPKCMTCLDHLDMQHQMWAMSRLQTSWWILCQL